MTRLFNTDIFVGLVVFATYVTAGKIGLAIHAVSGFASVIWPPTGIAIASLLIGGRKMIVPVAVAAFTINYQIGNSIPVAIGIACGNSLEAVTAAWLISRIKNFSWTFETLGQTLAFIRTVVFASTLVSSIIGTTILFVAGIAEVQTIATTFFTWWLGDGLGALIVLPLIMMIRSKSLVILTTKRIPEFLGLLFLISLLCLMLFFEAGPWRLLTEYGLRRVHLIYPFMIWAALRFGPFGSICISTIIGFFVSLGAKNAIAIFTSESNPESLIAVQVFLGISSITGLILSSAMVQNRTSELKFRSMFEISGVPMAQIDLNGLFTLVNDQFCQLTGYTREELLKMRFTDITYPEDVVPNDEALKRLITGNEKSLHFEKRYVRKDGSLIWVTVDSTLLKHSDEASSSAIIGVFSDVTKRKAAEHDAEEAYLMAKNANQAKSSFLASISHEIRTPLGAIIGFTDLLKDKNISESTRMEFIETAHRNAIELAELVDDILDLSKIEAGRMDISNEFFDLRNLIKDISETFRSAVNARGLTLNTHIDDTLPTQIKTDSKRLRQILINIVGNAVKYTSKGSIAVRVTSISEEPISGSLLGIYVEDTGCGIAEDEVPTLFKPFSRLERTQKRNIRGTGLGLELSRRLAKLLGGDIKLVKSQVDVGSTFLVTIDPGVKLDGHHQTTKSAVKPVELGTSKSTPPERLDGIKVLVAEDTPDQATLIRLYLTSVGARVELAENGMIAVEKALADNFDIALMDMQMPVLSGFEATETLRQHGFRKPIIALTAQAFKADQERCLESGCTSHVTKPFTREILIQEIRRCMSNNESSHLN